MRKLYYEISPQCTVTRISPFSGNPFVKAIPSQIEIREIDGWTFTAEKSQLVLDELARLGAQELSAR